MTDLKLARRWRPSGATLLLLELLTRLYRSRQERLSAVVVQRTSSRPEASQRALTYSNVNSSLSVPILKPLPCATFVNEKLSFTSSTQPIYLSLSLCTIIPIVACMSHSPEVYLLASADGQTICPRLHRMSFCSRVNYRACRCR